MATPGIHGKAIGRGLPRHLLRLAAVLCLALGARPQETLQLHKIPKLEETARQQKAIKPREMQEHPNASSFLQTGEKGEWPFPGYPAFQQLAMVQAMPAQYGPVAESYNLNPGLPPALQAQAASLGPGAPTDPVAIGLLPPPQSLLQNGQQGYYPQSLMQNGQQSYYGGAMGFGIGAATSGAVGAYNQNQLNYAANQVAQSFGQRDGMDGVDSISSHMEEIRNDQDIDRAISSLRRNLGDGTGNGHLMKAEVEANAAAEEVHNGVKAWEGVKKHTLEAVPLMARAVKASAMAIASEHKNLIKQVHTHGTQALKKFETSAQ